MADESPPEETSDDRAEVRAAAAGRSRVPYNHRIAILPGDPRVAYRPGVVVVEEDGRHAPELVGAEITPVFDDGESPIGQWYVARNVPDAPGIVDLLTRRGVPAHLDVVYFASSRCGEACPPHPALATAIAANPWAANPWAANPWAANPWAANPWAANPWAANPWAANPWAANPWAANPWAANPEALNIVATGKPPTSSAMPAPDRTLPARVPVDDGTTVIGVLDSGLAGGMTNADKLRPDLLGTDPASLHRISGQLDVPSLPIGGSPADPYLDPVAGHGTFIAGIIEQLTPGCTIHVDRVFEPEGDVDATTLAKGLLPLMLGAQPVLVNLSFGGTGRAAVFEQLIGYFAGQGAVFVASAGNEGTCVEQYPAALPFVVGVGALGPIGPAPWSNYGCWVDACAPGTDLVSSFFADFDGAQPPVNGMDPDEFEQWATWTGTSFATPVVVAALAREMVVGKCSAREAVDRIIRAPHLARLPYLGTIVNS